MTITLLHPTRRLQLFSDGQDLFNDEQFFEAHEAWEFLWKQEKDPDRSFIQGLILVAGHFVHLKKGSWSAAKTMSENAKQKLFQTPKQNEYLTLDIGPLIAALDYNVRIITEYEYKTLELQKQLPPPTPDSFLIPKLLEQD